MTQYPALQAINQDLAKWANVHPAMFVFLSAFIAVFSINVVVGALRGTVTEYRVRQIVKEEMDKRR